MPLKDVATDDLLKIIEVPLPPRPLGKRIGQRRQFAQFLADERLKPPKRNQKPVGAAPVAAFYKLYTYWRDGTDPKPPIIAPFRFAKYLKEAGFKRSVRIKVLGREQRLIGTDYHTAVHVRSFLTSNPLQEDEFWAFNPLKRWKKHKQEF